MREYVLIDPAERRVEAFTRTESGAWLFTDRTGTNELPLSSIDCTLVMSAVLEGVEGQAGSKGE